MWILSNDYAALDYNDFFHIWSAYTFVSILLFTDKKPMIWVYKKYYLILIAFVFLLSIIGLSLLFVQEYNPNIFKIEFAGFGLIFLDYTIMLLTYPAMIVLNVYMSKRVQKLRSVKSRNP